MVLCIIIYGTYRCNTKHYIDPLTKTIGPVSLNRFLDGWGISHFIFYGVLAYMFPDKKSLIFIAALGVAWEIIEVIFKEHPFYLSDCKYPPQTDSGAGWWYGRWEDIIMNSLGMLTGVILRHNLKH
jgi:hypothetical protein